MDGGKLKLEQLLQCEVEQQQRLTNLRRDTLRNLAIKAYFDRPVAVQQVIIACPSFLMPEGKETLGPLQIAQFEAASLR